MMLCISGSFGNKDLGDDAMLTAYLDMLAGIGFNMDDIVIIGHQPEYMSWYHGINIGRCISSKASIHPQIIRDCDCFLFTGGGTIGSVKPKSTSRTYDLVMPFASAGKPIFMSGQTLGPYVPGKGINSKAKRIIESVDYLSSRDLHWSREFIASVGAELKCNLVETCDDACGVSYMDSQVPEGIAGWARGSIAFNVTDYTAETRALREQMVAICNAIIEDTGRNLIMVPHHPKDYKHMGMMLKHLPQDKVMLIDTEKMRGGQVKKIVSMCDGAVGGRYHFIVFAGSTKVPFVGLAGNMYSYVKQTGYAEQIDRSQYILDSDNWDPGVVTDKLKSAMGSEIEKTLEARSLADFRKWIETYYE